MSWFRRKPTQATNTPETCELERERELLEDRQERAGEVESSLRQLRARNQFREQILLTVEESLHGR